MLDAEAELLPRGPSRATQRPDRVEENRRRQQRVGAVLKVRVRQAAAEEAAKVYVARNPDVRLILERKVPTLGGPGTAARPSRERSARAESLAPAQATPPLVLRLATLTVSVGSSAGEH